MLNRTKKLLLIFLVMIFFGVGATSSYFSDSKIVTGNVFSTGSWESLVINEVYFNIAETHGEEGKNEWIEIYNKGKNSVNLKGFVIENKEGSFTITTNSVWVPAGGTALISHNSGTWRFWEVPKNIPTVNLPGNFGSNDWLINSGDHLILKNPAGAILSAVSWGDDKTYCNLPTVLAGNSLSFVGPASCNYLENNPPTPGVK